jgi:hypothetical protein
MLIINDIFVEITVYKCITSCYAIILKIQQREPFIRTILPYIFIAILR